jgi:nitrate reductase NapE component
MKYSHSLTVWRNKCEPMQVQRSEIGLYLYMMFSLIFISVCYLGAYRLVVRLQDVFQLVKWDVLCKCEYNADHCAWERMLQE